jgi:hypothetical protein
MGRSVSSPNGAIVYQWLRLLIVNFYNGKIMTFSELYDKWSKNINAEYICPTLTKFRDANYVISKNWTKEQKLKALQLAIKEVKESK